MKIYEVEKGWICLIGYKEIRKILILVIEATDFCGVNGGRG